ncbi:MAG: 6,7-dimethyl-8-ribityllumazine synthase [Deltaproteobacteria bacterium]|nr:6,7-dimethyl-8-ribityllumazine synthase [Deltaproteobacteria bacterium]
MMMHEGKLSGAGLSFGVVVGRFNSLITERLLEGTLDCLRRHGTDDASIHVVRVPGSWEIPLALAWMAKEGRYDGLIALGCVIRGGTPHFDYVAAEVTKGAAHVQQSSLTPVSLGVLTTDSIDQAIERAGTKQGNKGWDAALAALEMANLKKGLG